jgi:GT2 family glycosyltransferase
MTTNGKEEQAELPKVAIIVLNFNTSFMTDGLAHYLNHDLNYPRKRVYVIDNGSSPPPDSATHKLPNNLGFTRGMYEGYRIAAQEEEYDAFWFLNSDVGFEYGNNILLDLIDVLFSSESFAQIAPQHNSPHKFMELAALDATSVPYLEPTATLIKRSTIERLGFWDLDLTYGWGVDYDYGYRIRDAGMLNILTRRARVSHKEHQSIVDLAEYRDKAWAEMHAVLCQKYGDDWGRIMSFDSKIVPLILSCDRDWSLTERFVTSYRSVQAGLAKPIVIVDTSAGTSLSPQYLSLILALDPRAIHIHGKEAGMNTYDSVQEAVHFGLRVSLEETSPSDLVLFIEDDILFSTHFLKTLRSLEVKPDTGFITLYRPGSEYGAPVIDPNHFYGTQCVLFPRQPIEEIVTNWDDIKSRIPPGYDIRWSRFLGERGYKLYSTDYSYVQHLQGKSRLHGHGSHVSHTFRA